MIYYLRKIYYGFAVNKEMILMVALIPVLMLAVIAYSNSPSLSIGLIGLYIIMTALSYVLSLRAFVFLGCIVLTENIFYLFNRSRLFYIYDLKQLAGLMLMGLTVLYLPRIIRSDFIFKRAVLALMGYYFITILVAYVTVGQSIQAGIYNLMIPSLILGYFFFSFLMEKVRRFEYFKDLYIYLSMAAGSLYLLQSFIYPKIIFLSTDFRQRYINVRFTEFTVFMNFAVFITLNRLLTEIKSGEGLKKYVYWMALILQCAAFFLVSQSRLQSITTLMLILVAVFFLQQQISKIMSLLLFIIGGSLIVCLTIIMMLSGYYFEGNIFEETLHEIIEFSGNLGIRLNGSVFYWQNMKNHWLLGWGNLNISNHNALVVSGRKFGYYMVDVGIVGYMYKFGIVGTGLSLILLGRSIWVSLKLYLRDKKTFYPLLCMMSVFINGIMIYYFQEAGALLYMGLILAFIEFEDKRRLVNE